MRQAIAWATLLTSAVPSAAARAQAVRRNDIISLNDRIQCTQPHSWASSNPAGFLDEGRLFAVHAAGTAQAIDRGALDQRTADGVGELRAVLTSTKPCADAWYVHVDGVIADAGARGMSAEATLPAWPLGHRGDHGSEAIGSLALYGGASTSRRVAYDPALDLTRDAWIGTTLQLGIPATIPIPVLGKGKIVVHAFASVQGDYAWDDSVRKQRGRDVVPHYNVVLPITILRTLGLPLVGLAYSYNRVEDFVPAGALQTHMLGLSTYWLGGHLTMTVHGGLESLGGQRVYRAAGVSLMPTQCAKCQITF